MAGLLSTVCALFLILGVIGHSDVFEKPIKAKPGGCPRFNWIKDKICDQNVKAVCLRDDDCPSHHKCCRQQCGSVCVAPIFVKPGVCPRNVWFKNLQCPKVGHQSCSHDYTCPGTLKCCYNGCGQLECLKPRVKRGSCPPYNSTNNQDCATWSYGCAHDYNCPRHLKCCKRGCRSECVAPDYRRG